MAGTISVFVFFVDNPAVESLACWSTEENTWLLLPFCGVDWVYAWNERTFPSHVSIKSCCLGEQMVQVIVSYGLCCYCWEQLWLYFICVASLNFQEFAGGCCHFMFISDSVCCRRFSALHYGCFCSSFLFGFPFIQIWLLTEWSMNLRSLCMYQECLWRLPARFLAWNWLNS